MADISPSLFLLAEDIACLMRVATSLLDCGHLARNLSHCAVKCQIPRRDLHLTAASSNFVSCDRRATVACRRWSYHTSCLGRR